MGLWTMIKDYVLGCSLITVADAKTIICDALDNMDTDKDGYVTVREIVALIKTIFRGM